MDHYYIKFIEPFTTFLSVTTFYLGTTRRPMVWPVSILISVLNMPLYYVRGLYSSVLLNTIYTIMSFHGWYKWKFGGENRTELKKITRMSLLQFVLIAAFCSLSTYGLHFVMQKMEASKTLLDGFRSALGIIGLWATAYKKLETYIVWFISNLISIILFYKEGMLWFSGKYVLLLIFSVYSFWVWFRKYREQAREEVAKHA